MFKHFKSGEEILYRKLEEAGDILHQQALSLEKNLTGRQGEQGQAEVLNGLKHKCDKICDDIHRELCRTFMAPFDREDILALARVISEVVDSIASTMEKINIFQPLEMDSNFKEMVGVLTKSTHQLKTAVYNLRKLKSKSTYILELCCSVRDYESMADHIYRRGMADLFKNGGDLVALMKEKEVLEHLETALDRTERVAKVVSGIVIKYA